MTFNPKKIGNPSGFPIFWIVWLIKLCRQNRAR